MATSSSFRFQWNGQHIAAQLEAAIEQAMEDTARAMRERAVELCPVGPDHADRSPHLYEEIDAQVEQHGHSRTIVLEADKEYAVFVETGTSRQPAQPFLRPAIDEEAPKLSQRVRQALQGIR